MGTTTLPFTQKLRKASRKEHSLSDSLVGARLIITATDKRLWAKALSSFWHVFSAIENALHNCKSNPEIAELLKILPKIERSAAFATDLQTFYGPNWKERAGEPSGPVATYLERIRAIQTESPHLLLAHAYTQHMAMMSGGQIMRRSVRSSLQIAERDPGTATFEFEEPVKDLKQKYKDLVDNLEAALGEAKSKEVVEEHRLVFRLNNEIIRTFPLTPAKTVSGLIRLIPVELLLLIISLVLALVMVLYTRGWIDVDPDSESLADPDFVNQ